MPGSRKSTHQAVRLTLENHFEKSGVRIKEVSIESIEQLKSESGNPLRVYHVRAEVW